MQKKLISTTETVMDDSNSLFLVLNITDNFSDSTTIQYIINRNHGQDKNSQLFKKGDSETTYH